MEKRSHHLTISQHPIRLNGRSGLSTHQCLPQGLRRPCTATTRHTLCIIIMWACQHTTCHAGNDAACNQAAGGAAGGGDDAAERCFRSGGCITLVCCGNHCGSRPSSCTKHTPSPNLVVLIDIMLVQQPHSGCPSWTAARQQVVQQLDHQPNCVAAGAAGMEVTLHQTGARTCAAAPTAGARPRSPGRAASSRHTAHGAAAGAEAAALKGHQSSCAAHPAPSCT